MPIGFTSEQFSEGEMAQTNCVLRKGDKPFTISWLFNDSPLFTNEDVQVLRVGRSSILTIDPVRGYNQGNYTCVASNPAGTVAVSSQLIVNGACIVI